ncbi:MAG: hypothetical protein OZ921_16770 [Sorangiineae bacterium]|nr:hypothetical protein [Polyangiaceae bacterium]MEB2324168.1 hypothetical protein [Sorangiineae bacterium]
MRRALSLALAALIGSGCSMVGLEADEAPPTENVCESSADCGGGACVGGQCHAQAGELTTVLFEITPPMTSGEGFAGVHFLERMTGLPRGGGALDLSIEQMAEVRGSVTLPSGATSMVSSCAFKVTFTPSERLLGLSATSYSVKNDASEPFSLGMPAGRYDIYVQPLPLAPAAPCEATPVVLRAQVIEAGNVELPIVVPEPKRLHLEVVPPTRVSLLDWSVALVDPLTGRALSVVRKQDATTADLDFLAVVGGDDKDAGHELLRLTPPSGLVAPTFLMDRSALELFTEGEATVTGLTFPDPVRLEGRVEVGRTSESVSADVSFVATQLDGITPGTLAGFARTVQSDAAGRFAVELLAGTYRVRAVPVGAQPVARGSGPAPLAASEDTWVVASSPAKQAGRLIQLGPSARLTGSVASPGGSVMSGATVQAIASPARLNAGVLDVALGEAPFVPRASSETMGDDGVFTLFADPGVYDVAVLPADGTGFAWLVRPNVEASTGIADLGRLTLPLPVVYRGSVTVAGRADPTSQEAVVVPGALIRAYVYMDQGQAYAADPAAAASVLQIAETRADQQGAFRLLLPSHLD